TSADERVTTGGTGETIGTDEPTIRRGLEAFAIAAIRHGSVESVSWTVDGRVLTLAPVNAAAAPVVGGEELRDLGSITARAAIQALGGELAIDGETLLVRL